MRYLNREFENNIPNPILHDDDNSAMIALQKITKLTKREVEILHLIVAGDLNKIIAHKLGISQRTVENHRNRILHKTGCHSQSALTCLFILTHKKCLLDCLITNKCSNSHIDCPIKDTSSE